MGPQQSTNHIEKQPSEFGLTHWVPLVKQLRDGRLLFGRPHRVRLERGAHVECWAWELAGCLAPSVRGVEEREGRKVRLGQNQLLDLSEWDQFVVKCYSWQRKSADDTGEEGSRALVYHNAFTNVATPKPTKLIAPPPTPLGPYSINIIVIDSTARSQFMRHVPLRWEFLRREGFHTLHGHVKVGDNSAINLLPLMAGRVFQARKRGFTEEMLGPYGVGDMDLASTDADFWPALNDSIFHLAKQLGYRTLWNDDIATSGFGLFHYNNFKGFRHPPADHYYRPFYDPSMPTRS